MGRWGKTKKLKGRFTISRIYGTGSPEECVRIEVTDMESGLRLIDVRTSEQVFAQALFSRSDNDCVVDLFVDERIGMTCENKTEMVPLPEGVSLYKKGEREEAISKALAPFEVDGWVGRRDDLTNMHRRAGDKAKVVFVRWVPKKEDDDDQAG